MAKAVRASLLRPGLGESSRLRIIPERDQDVGHPPAFPNQNRLLNLLHRYRLDPASLSEELTVEVEENLRRLTNRIGAGERLHFSEASFIDSETVCVVFTGARVGLCSLPNRASLLVDQEWNLSGGILFSGLRAVPVNIN